MCRILIEPKFTNFNCLQADSDGRVHTSINLNTETGRLSSSKPNLQNQPALEKDTYQYAPIPHKLFFSSFCQSQFSQKSVN